MTDARIRVRVNTLQYEALDVISVTLVPVDGLTLPPAEPGAHVNVHLPNDTMRSYSLSNSLDDGSYRLTVARAPQSRGGSNWMHDSLRIGQLLEIDPPANNFALTLTAGESIFIAGGIGITPFVPMARKLNALGKHWTLHYCVRTSARAALLRECQALTAAGNGRVVTNFDEEPGGAMLDLVAVMRDAAPDAHLYCCGPSGMLAAYRAAAEQLGIAPDRIHFEYFSNTTAAPTNDNEFTVELRKSGREIRVQGGHSILKALLDAKVSVQYSCEEGICGACETRVLEGTPDHRDMILSEHERLENKVMMVCCSGSKSPRLVLDL